MGRRIGINKLNPYTVCSRDDVRLVLNTQEIYLRNFEERREMLLLTAESMSEAIANEVMRGRALQEVCVQTSGTSDPVFTAFMAAVQALEKQQDEIRLKFFELSFEEGKFLDIVKALDSQAPADRQLLVDAYAKGVEDEELFDTYQNLFYVAFGRKDRKKIIHSAVGRLLRQKLDAVVSACAYKPPDNFNVAG